MGPLSALQINKVFSAIPSSLSFCHYLSYEGINVALQPILKEASSLRNLFRAGQEGSHVGPVGNEERLASLRVALDEVESTLLRFRILLFISVVAIIEPLCWLFALLAL